MQLLDLLHALALLWLQNNSVCLQNLRRLFVKWKKCEILQLMGMNY